MQIALLKQRPPHMAAKAWVGQAHLRGKKLKLSLKQQKADKQQDITVFTDSKHEIFIIEKRIQLLHEIKAFD